MEKSIQNPQLNRNVGDRLYEDSKWWDRELEIQQKELQQKAKDEASWGLHTTTTSPINLVEWLYNDAKAKQETNEERKWIQDQEYKFAPTLNPRS